MISQHAGARPGTIKCPHMVFYGNISDAIIVLSHEWLFKPAIHMLIINDFYYLTYTMMMRRK